MATRLLFALLLPWSARGQFAPELQRSNWEVYRPPYKFRKSSLPDSFVSSNFELARRNDVRDWASIKCRWIYVTHGSCCYLLMEANWKALKIFHPTWFGSPLWSIPFWVLIFLGMWHTKQRQTEPVTSNWSSLAHRIPVQIGLLVCGTVNCQSGPS